MAIFSSLSGFFNRNKRRILITGAVSVSIYLLINEFVIKKFRNYQQALRQELLFKQQIKQRFIQTQQDCYYTILALLPVLATPIIDALPVELITQALRLKKSGGAKNNAANESNELTTDNLNLLDNNNDPELKLSIYMNKSKIELWNLLKIKSITRTLTLMYTISGLLLITRLQLNILARRSYLESAIQMAGVKSINQEIDPHENYIIEQSYLSLSWWLLNKGWTNLNSIIEALVVAKFEKITPKSELSVEVFEQSLLDIINEINTNNKEYILANLFPINYSDLLETLLNTNPDLVNQLDSADSNLIKLINETNSIMLNNDLYFFDLLNSLILTNLHTLSTNLSFSLGGGNLGSSLLSTTGNVQDPRITELPNRSFKLASFLAQLSVQNNIMIDNDNIKNEDVLPRYDTDLEEILNSLNAGEDFPSAPHQQESGGNVYINNLNELDELDDFSAGIYSNFE
ncbi:Peroxisomal biogenesis factor 3 [Candida viswanathii]|uniref:Peroxin-3 n=1 Tax=Candida viswanathii TaxID=5486 RepID=A0A367XSC5_9ASCO|nr:Peroxisomal biogenesis factor 3 [Candida viswanathii]